MINIDYFETIPDKDFFRVLTAIFWARSLLYRMTAQPWEASANSWTGSRISNARWLKKIKKKSGNGEYLKGSTSEKKKS